MIRQMNIKDGYALKTAVDTGYKVCVISGGSSEGVRIRLKRLGLSDIYLGAHNKIDQFNEIINKYNLEANEVLYMGDDIPDYPVMKLVGLACSPKDAAPEIQGVSHYVSQKDGGKGCVRDVIEQVLKVQGNWDGKFDAKYD